jgi:hypothetical protein
VMRSKMSLTNEFRMAMALLEIPVSEVFAVFLAAFFFSIVLGGTSAAIDAGALLEVEAGLGAISMSSWARRRAMRRQVGGWNHNTVGLLVNRELVRQTTKVRTVELTRLEEYG